MKPIGWFELDKLRAKWQYMYTQRNRLQSLYLSARSTKKGNNINMLCVVGIERDSKPHWAREREKKGAQERSKHRRKLRRNAIKSTFLLDSLFVLWIHYAIFRCVAELFGLFQRDFVSDGKEKKQPHKRRGIVLFLLFSTASKALQMCFCKIFSLSPPPRPKSMQVHNTQNTHADIKVDMGEIGAKGIEKGCWCARIHSRSQ